MKKELLLYWEDGSWSTAMSAVKIKASRQLMV